MINFFTSVNKSVIKNTGFISRILGWNAKNTGSREKSTNDIRDMGQKFYERNGVEKRFAYFSSALYYELYKPQFFSQTGPAARVSCGVWYLTQGIDAEPAVYSHGINSTRVPSPLVASGTDKMGGKNNRHKPLRYFEAACAVAESVSCLSVLGFRDEESALISKAHLKPVVANAQSVTVVRTTEFDNVSMLQGMSTLTQNDQLALNSDAHILGEAREGLLSPWVYQDGEHENYLALFTRLLIPANGIQELALSASLMRRSSLITSSDIESSKKSIKSSNIFLDMIEDGATTPRIFSSLIIVMDDLFMTSSIAHGI